MAVQSDSFPCPGSSRLYVRHRALRMPCLATLAAAALVVVLALARAPAVYAGSSHTVALTAIHAAAAQYVVGYLPTPDIGATLSVSPRYVAPWVWDGVDPDDPEFEPETVEVTATAADQDTAVMWYPWFPYTGWILVLDPISVHNLAGPAGFSITEPWFGTTVKGEFSTVHCGEQQAARVTQAITWEADDQAMYGEGSDDETVEMTENVYVVLPNAARTAWVEHFAEYGEVCIGDTYEHQAIYLPPDASPTNPAVGVNFEKYKVQEGNWELLEVVGLNEGEVLDWFNQAKGDWNGTAVLEMGNTFTDHNGINRWAVSVEYDAPSFRSAGEIRLRQGWHAIEPNEGPYWYYEIEYHFIGPSQGSSEPGECHTRKQGHWPLSSAMEWVQCEHHTPACPFHRDYPDP